MCLAPCNIEAKSWTTQQTIVAATAQLRRPEHRHQHRRRRQLLRRRRRQQRRHQPRHRPQWLLLLRLIQRLRQLQQPPIRVIIERPLLLPITRMDIFSINLRRLLIWASMWLLLHRPDYSPLHNSIYSMDLVLLVRILRRLIILRLIRLVR